MGTVYGYKLSDDLMHSKKINFSKLFVYQQSSMCKLCILVYRGGYPQQCALVIISSSWTMAFGNKIWL